MGHYKETIANRLAELQSADRPKVLTPDMPAYVQNDIVSQEVFIASAQEALRPRFNILTPEKIRAEQTCMKMKSSMHSQSTHDR